MRAEPETLELLMTINSSEIPEYENKDSITWKSAINPCSMQARNIEWSFQTSLRNQWAGVRCYEKYKKGLPEHISTN